MSGAPLVTAAELARHASMMLEGPAAYDLSGTAADLLRKALAEVERARSEPPPSPPYVPAPPNDDDVPF